MKEPQIIEKLRKCKEKHSCFIQGHSCLDVQSVAVILAVYDSMSDEGKKSMLEKIDKSGIYRVARACWGCIA